MNLWSFTLTSMVRLFILASLLAACSGQAVSPPQGPSSNLGSPGVTPTDMKATGPPTSSPSSALGSTPGTPKPEPGTKSVTPPQRDPVPTQPVRTQYLLSAVLDYGSHHLSVQESIAYRNNSQDSLLEIPLAIEPSRYPDTFELNEITWGGGNPIPEMLWDGSYLRLRLAQPLLPGQDLVLDLDYELNLPSPQPSPEVRPVPFGYTSRQANLVDWYPFIPPYIPGQGWLTHQAGFFGEHLVYEMADFQVDIRLEGNSTSPGENGELIVAASAPASRQGEWYRYSLESARSFAWSVSHQYIVKSQIVDGVTVLSYAFPYHEGAGDTTLKASAQALVLFNQLFGPYPRETLSVVEADFLDGMEYDGLFFLSNGFYNISNGTPAEYLTAIAVHETAHLWWYGLVGNDQALEPWLDEALCTYSERLFYEHYYQETHPEVLDWWWTYRINYYEPRGWVDGSIYNPQGYRAYRDAVYLNGAVFLEELRQRIGDEAFTSFVKDYAKRQQGQIATSQDFFTILMEHTSEDIQDVVSRYFQENPLE